MRAFIVEDTGDPIALNHTQLNFDYCMASRVGQPDFEYFVTYNWELVDIDKYDHVIVAKSGTIFPYGYYETLVDQINEIEAKFIDIGPVTVIKPSGINDRVSITPNWQMDDIAHVVVKNSQGVYILHNEIPIVKSATDKDVEWAMTLSSGFYINYILKNNGFKENADIHHVDISKQSLMVREYTIKNWDGLDFYYWVKHLHKKFPMLKLFSKKVSGAVLAHMDQYFVDWLDHWKMYQNCNHHYHYCNINFIDNILQKHSPRDKSSVFWFNGALKRMPANLNKTSRQGYEATKQFLNTLGVHNQDMIVYGSDHCVNEYNGISVRDAIRKTTFDSREKLWKRIPGHTGS